MTTEEHAMRRAISLASKGAGRTKTNPLVGSVIVNAGRVVGEGFHSQFGGPHAETVALAKAGPKARGSTLFVTLEPCVRFAGKKTPSCAEAIVAAGVKRVVIAMRDVNPKVAGKGITLLRKAGIKVESGLLELEAAAINAPFIKLVSTGLPFVHLKMAVAADGFIWSPQTSQISNAQSSLRVQHLRNTRDAIMVGVGTVLADNPRLTCRLQGGRDPLRVIVDSRLRSPLSAKVFNDANCVVFTASGCDKRKKAALEKKGIPVFSTAGKRVNLKQLLKQLAGLKVSSILLEGGRELAQSFIDAGLVDAFTLIFSKKRLHEGVKAPRFGPLEVMSAKKSGGDLVVRAKPLLQAPRPRRS
jgi:diaminohydroxyphosphoribosylaminopyrimidine deaminase/5-amino-6-(5-phosphoribosylamino)uracil reductase